jgi:hypothetical protein
LHSFIPHKHYDELKDYEQKATLAEARGVIDFMQMVFLTDLGEGHMETFDQCDNIELKANFSTETDIDDQVTTFAFVLTSSDYQHYPLYFRPNYTEDVPIFKEYFLSHVDFRGPPISV